MKKYNNVNYYRNKKGITQNELAFIVETSETTISQIETYNREPKVYLALKLAKALNTTVEDLFKKR